MESWCKLPEDGDSVETCRSLIIERIPRVGNCSLVGVMKVLVTLIGAAIERISLILKN
jgi:hypothetical protein